VATTKKKKTPQDEAKAKARKALTDYIQNVYVSLGWNKEDINWKLLMSQVKNLEQEDKKYTSSSILYTLYFMNEVLQINMLGDYANLNDSILNLVPFYFQDARAHYFKVLKVQESVKNFHKPDDVIVYNKGGEIKKKDKRTKRNLSFD
jgi:hypothetical protein